MQSQMRRKVGGNNDGFVIQAIRSGRLATAVPIIWSEATPSIHFWKETNSYACAEVSELESRPDYLQRFLDLWRLKSKPI